MNKLGNYKVNILKIKVTKSLRRFITSWDNKFIVDDSLY